MNGNWLEYAGTIRLLCALTVLMVLIALELWWPRRGVASPPQRRLRNAGLAILSTALVRLLVPVTVVAFAAQVAAQGDGMLATIDLPTPINWVATIIGFDLAIYWQHRLMHRIPVLWRIHRVHHSDAWFDATLGLRFHPLEILISTIYKLGVIALLGPAPQAVAAYEILLVTFSLLTHADIAIPERWDSWARLVVVTPDWHRVHHSVREEETNSNYGNFLTLWDRVFLSRIEQPTAGHQRMVLGLPQFRSPRDQTIGALLLNPFTPQTRFSSSEDS
ncbi:MAG: sterol desaturase family protein [Proteobacteria bacterium]|nr:sterol desaturase family protein [Pseudomonadota bacterium]